MPTQDHKGFSIMFSFWSFIDLGFTVRSMICFELIFGYDVKYGQKFNFFSTCLFNCFSTISWKDYILSTKLHLYSCQKSVAHVWIYLWILYSVSLIFFFILMPILYHTLLVTIALWWVLKSDGVSPLTLFFWTTFLPSHQKTKLECMWRVLVLVLCLVRDLRESPKAIVLHPRHLFLLLTAVLETPEHWVPISLNQVVMSCGLRAGVSAQGKDGLWDTVITGMPMTHLAYECPECSVLNCDKLIQ